jgi:hypothetical protein
MSMSDLTPTYAFEGEEVFAMHEGKVIASGPVEKMAEVEGEAVKYLDSLKTTRDQVAKDNKKKTATHIVTPNGVKGEILGRTPTVWGTQITARFENGTITQFETHGEDGLSYVHEKTASTAKDPSEGLEQRLAKSFDRDRDSLAARHRELGEIAKEAFRLIQAGAPYAVEVKLDQVRTAAEVESRQVKEAIDHLDAADYESFIPEAPFKPQVVEQAGVGSGADSNWLDVTTQEIISESEGQDFDKILNEGPGLFVAEQDTAALADAGVTREMALSHITSKTAGFQGEEVDSYRTQFLARVETARREELATRKASTKKEAAAEQETLDNVPDEALFS